MFRRLILLLSFIDLLVPRLLEAAPGVSLVERSWIEARSAHFTIYSCAPSQSVFRLASRLEQFSEAYSSLAGSNAVASPPIAVVAFPDEESMKPFQPLYQGKPGNLAGFFQRGTDENLIVMALPSRDSAMQGMEVIFHEYTHLLLRKNANIWPLWLHEGMADLYSTFQTSGKRAFVARPMPHYLRVLESGAWMPLRELFGATHDSPQYNESDRQGVFYAESWLLTHYLVAGDNAILKARFSNFTALLRQGQNTEQAFTNALGISLDGIENALRGYLKRKRFTTIVLALSSDVSAPKTLATKTLTPVDIRFRLGKTLMAVDRLDAAEAQFRGAQELAPANPLGDEGLGLIAAERGQHSQAVSLLKRAIDRGSHSLLAAYVYAREKYRLTADAEGRYAPLDKIRAQEMRSDLTRPTMLRPDFAPAHQLLGFFEMVQGTDLDAAERHLRASIQLEPDNPSYLIALAQAQMRRNNNAAARQTLQPLLLPSIEPKLRKPAEDLIKEMSPVVNQR